MAVLYITENDSGKDSTVQGKVMSLRCKNGKEKFNESVHTSGKGEDKE
jgi:hypothetical protein